MGKKSFLITVFLFLFSFISFAQNLPNGYLNINLGMSLDETKEELLKNPDFGYSGDRDVSLLPGDARILIETDASNGRGSPFLTQCWFQFYNEQLYIITININSEKTDYYSLFTTLSNKYGEPKSLNPTKATWENDEITLTLEKPLSVKYIDNETFDMLKNSSLIEKSFEEKNIQDFLSEF